MGDLLYRPGTFKFNSFPSKCVNNRRKDYILLYILYIIIYIIYITESAWRNFDSGEGALTYALKYFRSCILY